MYSAHFTTTWPKGHISTGFAYTPQVTHSLYLLLQILPNCSIAVKLGQISQNKKQLPLCIFSCRNCINQQQLQLAMELNSQIQLTWRFVSRSSKLWHCQSGKTSKNFWHSYLLILRFCRKMYLTCGLNYQHKVLGLV